MVASRIRNFSSSKLWFILARRFFSISGLDTLGKRTKKSINFQRSLLAACWVCSLILTFLRAFVLAAASSDIVALLSKEVRVPERKLNWAIPSRVQISRKANRIFDSECRQEPWEEKRGACNANVPPGLRLARQARSTTKHASARVSRQHGHWLRRTVPRLRKRALGRRDNIGLGQQLYLSTSWSGWSAGSWERSSVIGQLAWWRAVDRYRPQTRDGARAVVVLTNRFEHNSPAKIPTLGTLGGPKITCLAHAWGINHFINLEWALAGCHETQSLWTVP